MLPKPRASEPDLEGLSRRLRPSPLAPWPHFCFYDLPKLLFGIPKRRKTSLQRLRDCFGRPLTPTHAISPGASAVATASATASSSFSRLRQLFCSRSASHADSLHLPWRLGRTSVSSSHPFHDITLPSSCAVCTATLQLFYV